MQLNQLGASPLVERSKTGYESVLLDVISSVDQTLLDEHTTARLDDACSFPADVHPAHACMV